MKPSLAAARERPKKKIVPPGRMSARAMLERLAMGPVKSA
jgi:hypothetical protein